ncbi:putative calcium-dependent cell-adhesion protein [Cichlidogyrus casuarinus]|uniref:Calcium-dependent cell-adhesion protein n=1 Tax=Cichlidogyrus casuarinus TaxID=1844966 RepID=A0ABD2PVM7_9PLAT
MSQEEPIFVLEHRRAEGQSLRLSTRTGMVLDREQQAEYKLLLLAYDMANFFDAEQAPGRLTSTLTLVIRVEDVNDNVPHIQPLDGPIIIPETTAPGTVIYSLNATDPDDGLNGKVRFSYSASERHSAFQIEAESYFSVHSDGRIVVKQKPDVDKTAVSDAGLGHLARPVTRRFRFKVQAEDLNPPPHLDETEVIVQVQDVNDERPELFFLSESFSVLENQPKDTLVGVIEVLLPYYRANPPNSKNE